MEDRDRDIDRAIAMPPAQENTASLRPALSASSSASSSSSRSSSLPPAGSPSDIYTDTEEAKTVADIESCGNPLDSDSDNGKPKSSWWFASTAVPLLAATTGPLSNVLSIAALVTPWRVQLLDNGQLPLGIDDSGTGISDPHWEIILNAFSLACGFTGNFFLLLNFTGRVRYIVALPLSIVFWVLASIILISISAAMHAHDAPIGPGQIYSQGFWHAVLASILYFIGSAMLVVNMLGYVRGHYPQKFDLDDDQRTLILQTMMFFFWLAAGAGVYVRLEGWSYSNALYFADVSVLTVGFGDIYPTTNAGRGFLFVYTLIGITSLGLVISSITRFVRDISANKIVRSHELHSHRSTLSRTVTDENELRDRLGLPPRSSIPGTIIPASLPKDTSLSDNGSTPPPSAQKTITFDQASMMTGKRQGSLAANENDMHGRFEIVGNRITYRERKATVIVGGRGGAARRVAISRDDTDSDDDGENSHLPQWLRRRRRRRQRQQQRKLLLLREEKDRFDAMREIQEETRRFKQYWSLAMSVLAFGTLWCMGALVFMFAEKRLQNLSYFEALYFGFVSLLTIGYGDMSPKSNAGKAFFIVWSLIAVPTMTILIQEMSATVVATVNRGTFKLADWTIMPKKGLAKAFVANIKAFFKGIVDLHNDRLYQTTRRQQEAQRQLRQMEAMSSAGSVFGASTYELASPEEREAKVHHLARQLGAAIRDVAHELGAEPPKKYTFDEWVRFSELIRFSRRNQQGNQGDDADESDNEGPLDWDWIGEDSPMLADTTEAQWLLDRLCESLNRYTRQQATARKTREMSTSSMPARMKSTGEASRSVPIASPTNSSSIT